MIRETSPLHLLPSGSEVNVNAIYKIFLFYCNELKAEASLVLCQYLVQPKMKISPLHQLASDLECLQHALYNRSNSSGERKLQWLCVLTVL